MLLNHSNTVLRLKTFKFTGCSLLLLISYLHKFCAQFTLIVTILLKHRVRVNCRNIQGHTSSVHASAAGTCKLIPSPLLQLQVHASSYHLHYYSCRYMQAHSSTAVLQGHEKSYQFHTCIRCRYITCNIILSV